MIAIREIREKCHRQKIQHLQGQGVLGRSYALHRWISLPLTWIFLNAFPAVTPNQVSVAMLVCGLVGAGFLAMPSEAAALTGLALLYLSFLLDKVDGDIARFRARYSRLGKIVDEWYHVAPQPMVFLSYGVHVSVVHQMPLALILGLACHTGALITRVTPKYLALVSEGAAPSAASKSRHDRGWRKGAEELLAFVLRFDVVLLAMAGGVVAELVAPGRRAASLEGALLAVYAVGCMVRLGLVSRFVRRVLE